jgi:acetyl-CoA C-acetyltransferase
LPWADTRSNWQQWINWQPSAADRCAPLPVADAGAAAPAEAPTHAACVAGERDVTLSHPPNTLPHMANVVIVEAVRTPVGRRGGGLSSVHPADLLATVQREVVERAGIDPAEVGQVVGGCVSQVGEQSFNIARTAWLTAGLPLSVAATTVDTQCGSSQQATNLATGLVAGGVVDVAVACGVEVMSRVPIGANAKKDLGLGVPIPKTYFPQYEFTSQFEGAERIADKWGITRQDADAFGLRSQQLAARAWEEDRFGGQVVPVDAPDLDDEGKPTDSTHRVERDEGLRETSLEKLGQLKPVARPDGVHTAGSSSQISDGAAAVLMMTEERAAALGLQARARVVDTCLVGVDPVLMLTGPIDATQKLFDRTGLGVDDIDVVEINEAFASVVLAWQRELGFSDEQTNPNGGAIALGHPLGGTGAVLMTKALHELERSGGRYGLVTMCCGGGLGTGTILERL